MPSREVDASRRERASDKVSPAASVVRSARGTVTQQDNPLLYPCVCPWCLHAIKGPWEGDTCLGCRAPRPPAVKAWHGLSTKGGGWPTLKGVVVDGKYTLIERVWENLGAVFRVTDPQGEVRALKVLAGKYRGTELEGEFDREIKNHTGLSVSSLFVNVVGHENLYGHDRVPCGKYMVMEWVPWPTLEACVPVGQGIDAPAALRIAVGLLEAVKVMHGKSLLHHDLKPGNVFIRVDAQGRLDVRDNGDGVKVGDLGLASHRGRPRTSLIQLNQFGAGGTSGYMSPERLIPAGQRTANIDERADLWAVGAMLWEMVTGELPFDENVAAINMRETALPAAAQMSAALRAVLVKALTYDPADRYASAEAFLADLRAVERSQHAGVYRAPVAPVVAPVPEPVPPPVPAAAKVRPVTQVAAPPPRALTVWAEPPSQPQGWHGEVMPDGLYRAEEREHAGHRRYWHPLPDGDRYLMVYIPSGRFWRGSDDGFDWEKPRHVCEITKPFYLGVHPVTVGQFRRMVKAAKHDAGTSWESPGFAQTDAHPVVCVNWDDAVVCGGAVGLRLPTEAEWELAARGAVDLPANAKYPKGRAYPWGDEVPTKERPLLDRVWWSSDGNLGSAGGTRPAGVRPKGASPYGVQDMAGNVWEWCADFADWPMKPYDTNAAIDPVGSGVGSSRVGRGGSWDGSDARSLRAAFRRAGLPGARDDYLGFRLARGRVPALKPGK